jgi:hypothetical protein
MTEKVATASATVANESATTAGGLGIRNNRRQRNAEELRATEHLHRNTDEESAT